MLRSQPVVQPLPLVRERVLGRRQVDVDVVALDLDREAAQVVGELVERAAGAEVEARVVPVAGQDPVGDRAAVERKAHVRAAVVDRVDVAVLDEEADRVAVEVDDHPPGCAQVLQRCGPLALRGSRDCHAGDTIPPATP